MKLGARLIPKPGGEDVGGVLYADTRSSIVVFGDGEEECRA